MLINFAASGKLTRTGLQHSGPRGTAPVLQAELHLEVAPFLTFALEVLGAVALLLDVLQLLAH